MGFDLYHRRLDSRAFDDLFQLLQIDVRQADRPALALVHQALQRLPRLSQCHAGIVDNLAALVLRLLVAARFEGKGRMDEIAIDMVELKSPATRLEGGFDPLGTMIVVPELGGDEHVLALDRPRLEHLLHGIADGLFIAVAFRTIEVTKPHFQGRLGRLSGLEGIRNQRAESQGGHCPGAVGEGDLRIAKSVGRWHPDYFAFLFSISIRSLAAGPDEAGFWPVISWPSTTV